MENKESAIQTLAREELGIDPDELGGSAWEAALTSFFLFALGAIVPLFAFIFWTGMTAVFISIGMSTVGLFILGSVVTLFTGQTAALFRAAHGDFWPAGSRDHLWHWASLIGVSIGG